MYEMFQKLDQSSFAAWIQSSTYAFPILDALHVVSVVLVFGSIAMLDLRLLGISARSHAATKISQEVLPWTWVSFLVSVITGTLLFIAQASSYYINPEFRIKMLLMLLAGLNLAVFHFFIWSKVHHWDSLTPPPPTARIVATLSLILWAGVVVSGRWIGWTLSPV